MTVTPHMLELADLDELMAHVARHRTESGKNELPFMPFGRDDPWDREAARERNRKRWTITPGEPGWGRAWAVFDDARIVAHVTLQAASLRSATHRATLALGVERSHRRRGYGRRLSEHAIAWARQQPFLDWIDLGVFAHNETARRLYRNLGFEELGVVADRFRVEGVVVDDVAMCLWVGAEGEGRRRG